MNSGYMIVRRLPGQTVMIGDAELRIGTVRGNEVQLLIRAPQGTRILRPSKEEDKLDRASARRKGNT